MSQHCIREVNSHCQPLTLCSYVGNEPTVTTAKIKDRSISTAESGENVFLEQAKILPFEPFISANEIVSYRIVPLSISIELLR